MRRPTREERIKTGEEIACFLESLPQVKPELALNHHDLFGRLDDFDKVIQNLKGFVSFLSKLKDIDYWGWMHEAFTSPMAKLTSKEQEETSAHALSGFAESGLDTSEAYNQIALIGGNTPPLSKKKRRRAKTTPLT